MKQRQPKRRKQLRQPRKRLPPETLPPRSISTDIPSLPRKVSNAVLDPVGTPDTPLPLRDRQPTKRLAPSTSKKGMAPEDGLLLLREAAAAEKNAAPYKEMLSWIKVLEALIVELPKQHRGIGDNLQPIGDDELHSIINLVFILKHQPVVPTAPDDVRAAGSRLKKKNR